MTHSVKQALILLALAPLMLIADAPAGSYSMDFEKLAEGKPPEELVILSGEYVIRAEGGNKFIELAGAPLDTQGFMAGPDTFTTGVVSARIQASATGKRFPEFGIGGGGPSGYKLWVMPAAGEVQITQGEKTLATARYTWTSGEWTRLKFTAGKSADGKFKIQGKAWPDGKDEPKEASVSLDIPEAPPTGRGTFWSTPYAGTPTRFDDLVVAPGQ